MERKGHSRSREAQKPRRPSHGKASLMANATGDKQRPQLELA
jgi:hypothetical protein